MHKGNIVNVIKKSKIRWNPAPKGVKGYVVSTYTNSWGTRKVVLIDKSGIEYCTTDSCIATIKQTDKDKDEFDYAIKKWVEDTHMPVVFETTIVPTNSSKKAICCKFINKKETQWVPLSVLKDSNCDDVTLKSFVQDKCYSGYISLWAAKKMGLVNS